MSVQPGIPLSIECEKRRYYLGCNLKSLNLSPWIGSIIIICDPPSYVKRRKDLNKGKKAYIRLFAKVLEIAPLGGVVALASCSSHIDRKIFREIVNEASRVSKSPLTIHSFTSADIGHAYPHGFPEFDYLQFMVVSIAN